MKKFLFAIGMVALLGMNTGQAQAQVSFGAHANWASEADIGLGARAAIGLPVENLKVVPSFDYYFPASVPGISTSWMEFNGNVHYSFPLEDKPSLLPYAGGGLNFVRYSVKYDGIGGGFLDTLGGSANYTGLNLLGGVQFGSFGTLKPFAELRYTTSVSGQIVISGGVNF